MLLEYIQRIEAMSPEEVQSALLKILIESPSLIYNPELLFAALTGTEETSPVSSLHDSVREVLSTFPDQEYYIDDLAAMVHFKGVTQDLILVITMLETDGLVKMSNDGRVRWIGLEPALDVIPLNPDL